MKDRTKGDPMTQEERWTTEHIDISGNLSVPVEDASTKTPARDGWEPFFVAVNLAHPTVAKNVKYRRVATDATVVEITNKETA